MPLVEGRVVDWTHKINIKQFLSDDDSDEALRVAREGVANELRKLYSHFPEDDYQGDELRDLVHDIARAETVEEFNEWLDPLYDWADWNLVWLGLR
jgi:hypothetical protein